MSREIIALGDYVIGGGQFTLLAGPCTAESEKLCLEVAEYVSQLCRDLQIQYVFKASFDKANRTSGSSRRGPGRKKGLKFLASVKKHFHIPVVTDVHECEDVEETAEVADILQIPAFLCRQTDLLLAAGKTGRIVNIKKGQFMAPEDMAGALEKVRSTGNDKVMLTERGTSFGYHNLVVDMRGLAIMGGLGVPVVFDATHSVQLPGGLGKSSGGQREFVAPLARAAAAVGIDALFTEVHPRPAEAWSDGANSLDFPALAAALKQVKAVFDLTARK